jgi:hypothetical protein
MRQAEAMEMTVTGTMIEWRGPAPFWFLPFTADDSAIIDELKPMLTYGWGCIPVTCRIRETTFTTSIMPRQGLYLIPLKDAVRKAEGIVPEVSVTARVSFEVR